MSPTRTPPWTGELLLRRRPSSQKGPNTLGGPKGCYDELSPVIHSRVSQEYSLREQETHKPKGYGKYVVVRGPFSTPPWTPPSTMI